MAQSGCESSMMIGFLEVGVSSSFRNPVGVRRRTGVVCWESGCEREDERQKAIYCRD